MLGLPLELRGARPSRPARASFAAVVGLCLAAPLGCSDPVEAPPAAQKNQLPMPEGGLLDYPVDQIGPFNVGYRTWVHTYQPDGIAGARDIRLNIWYPTLDKEGPHPYYLTIFEDNDVFEGASLAPPMEPAGYPVHVHSHGHSGWGGTSSDLMRYFASHGWVAIAPDHTGNLLPDNNTKTGVSMHFLRPMDISASLDALEALATGDPLAGKCRTEKVIMSGHSRGTVTTWATGGATLDTDWIQTECDSGTAYPEPCTPAEIAIFKAGLGDPRIAAGLPMAGGVGKDEPGWFGFTGYDAVKKPYMLMSGTDDPVGAENVFARVTAIDFTWLDFEGGCHQLFALGGCEKFPQAEGYALVNTYALAFAERHILGDMSAKVAGILDGSEVLSAKVHYMHK